MKTDTGDSESEIKAQIKDALRAARWVVIDTADSRPVRKQLASFPDLFCFRHGSVLLIEAKAKGGRLRPGQLLFKALVEPHLGEHLTYVVARSLDDLPAFALRVGCNV